VSVVNWVGDVGRAVDAGALSNGIDLRIGDKKKTGGLRGGGPPVKRSARGLLNRSVEAGFVQGFLEGGG
jgi:hypothetical protein